MVVGGHKTPISRDMSKNMSPIGNGNGGRVKDKTKYCSLASQGLANEVWRVQNVDKVLEMKFLV